MTGTDNNVKLNNDSSGTLDAQKKGIRRKAAGRGNRHKESQFIKPTDVIRLRGGIDRPMLAIVIILICFGSIMVFSSSYAFALQKYGDSYHYIKNQIFFVSAGLIAMFFAMRFDYLWLRKATVPLFIVTLGLLFAVLVLGVAKGSAQRWIYIGGISIQPSEIMKFSLVTMLALYIAVNQDRITNYKNEKQARRYGVLFPLGIIGFACGFVALERHLSGTIILFLIGITVVFVSGAAVKWLAAAGGLVVAAFIPVIAFTSYAQDRINAFINRDSADALGEAWQTLQGLNAIGSGGFLGVGLGNSLQKHGYVPEPQNDFIFSIVCEELGFVGAMTVVALFILFIWRGFVIALNAPDTFSTLVVIGLVAKVALQSMLNICVVTSLIPNTGIALPFFSYGGTATMMQLGEMGILLSISRYSYQQK